MRSSQHSATTANSNHSIDSLLGSLGSGVSECIIEEDPVDMLCIKYCGRFVDLSNLVSLSQLQQQKQAKEKQRKLQRRYPSTVTVLAIKDVDAQHALSKARLVKGTGRTVARTQSTDSTKSVDKKMSASSHSKDKKRISRHNSGVGAVRMTYDGSEEQLKSVFPTKLLGQDGPVKRGLGRSRSAMQIDPAKTSLRGIGRSNSSDNPTGISAPPLLITRPNPKQQPYFRYPTIEITPGVYERLRGSEETVRAIERGHITICDCLICNSCLVTIGDAEFVLCPDCKVVSPIVLSDNDSSHEHTKRHYGRECEEPAVRGGVGLGVHAASCGMVVDDVEDHLDGSFADVAQRPQQRILELRR